MRWLILLVLCLVGCAQPAVLYTDETFRAASPELIAAWRSLAPLRDARVEDLAAGTGFTQLKKALEKDKAPTVVVGAVLTPAEQTSLQAGFPKSSFLFIATDARSDQNTLGVRRAEAWALVGSKAAAAGPAAVFFPPDATPGEIQEFQTAWNGGGGGTLATSTAYNPALLTGGMTQVFQWGGSDWDTLVQSLDRKVSVHGNPGMARPAGTSGLTWRIQETGLAEFLWKAATDSGKQRHFLPLETVLDRR